MTDENQANRLWLVPGGASHQALQAIVLDKLFLKSLEQVSCRKYSPTQKFISNRNCVHIEELLKP